MKFNFLSNGISSKFLSLFLFDGLFSKDKSSDIEKKTQHVFCST